jgi:hypothetical protein
MATPNIKAPTKKAFHFPKSATGKSAVEAKPVAKAKSKAPPRKKTPASKSARTSASRAARSKQAATSEATALPVSNEGKGKRPKKEKVVRDSFTMPKSDYAKIASLKQKCHDNGVRVKKSELLRAALTMLDAASAEQLLTAVKGLEAVETGRPSNV